MALCRNWDLRQLRQMRRICFFLHASPTYKLALENIKKPVRTWGMFLPCSSHVPPMFLPSSSHFSADENRRRKERTKEQWGRCFCTGAWRCVLKGLGFSPSKRPEKEGQIVATITIRVLASIRNNQIDESGLSVRVTLTLQKRKKKKGCASAHPEKDIRKGWLG